MWFRWEQGRQGGDYHKKLLFQFGMFGYGIDCYLIKFEPNALLKPHRDKVDGKHLRLNYEYKGEGTFMCKNMIIDKPKLKLFRPDVYIHSMQNKNNERRIFSVGVKY